VAHEVRRKQQYGTEARATLKEIWEALLRPCQRRLHPHPGWLESGSAHPPSMRHDWQDSGATLIHPSHTSKSTTLCSGNLIRAAADADLNKRNVRPRFHTSRQALCLASVFGGVDASSRLPHNAVTGTPIPLSTMCLSIAW
jgi:hypothetical protein